MSLYELVATVGVGCSALAVGVGAFCLYRGLNSALGNNKPNSLSPIEKDVLNRASQGDLTRSDQQIITEMIHDKRAGQEEVHSLMYRGITSREEKNRNG